MNFDQLTQFRPTHYAGLPPQIFADAVDTHLITYLESLCAAQTAEAIVRGESSQAMQDLAKEIADLQAKITEKKASLKIEETKILDVNSPNHNAKYAEALEKEREAKLTAAAAYEELQIAVAQMRLDESVEGEIEKSNVEIGIVADEKGFCYRVSVRRTDWGGWGLDNLDDAIAFNLWLAERKLSDAVTFEVSLSVNKERLSTSEFNQLFIVESRGKNAPPGLKAEPIVFKRTKKDEQNSVFVMSLLDKHELGGATPPVVRVPTAWLDRNFVDSE